MKERKGIVTIKGNPLTLLGDEVMVGDKAPDFEVIDNELSPVKFSSFLEKICILSSVPSLDTPVCDMETRRFNKEAEHLSSDVAVLTISMDLPFAQKRWCGAAGVDRVQTLSDHRDASFGASYLKTQIQTTILCYEICNVDFRYWHFDWDIPINKGLFQTPILMRGCVILRVILKFWGNSGKSRELAMTALKK